MAKARGLRRRTPVKNTFEVTGHHDAARLMVRRRAGRPLPKRAWPKNFKHI